MSERGESRADWVDSDDGEPANEFRGPLPAVMAGFLLLVMVGGLLDLMLDAPDRVWSFHVLFELGMVISSLAFAVMLFRGWRRSAAAWSSTRCSLEESQRLVAQRQAERDAWRHSAESALAGFSEAINRQFDAWHCTRAERDVALLILKGAGRTLRVLPARPRAAVRRPRPAHVSARHRMPRSAKSHCACNDVTELFVAERDASAAQIIR